MSIKFGVHGCTWELDYDKEMDNLDQLIEVVSKSGFKGIDVQVALLGRYTNNPDKLKETLQKYNIELAALTVPFSWESDQESEEERKRADYYIHFLKQFPNAKMNLPVRNGKNRDNLLKRQTEIIKCVNDVAKRAYENGVVASFHPASPANSYFRTQGDYQVLFEGLDRRYIGYTPDVGHIKMGGMDPVEVVKNNLSIIKHVHFKDCSDHYEWKKMGSGDIDFPAIVQVLKDYKYKGWIMVEEETKEATVDPEKVIYDIHSYVSEKLISIVKGGTLV